MKKFISLFIVLSAIVPILVSATDTTNAPIVSLSGSTMSGTTLSGSIVVSKRKIISRIKKPRIITRKTTSIVVSSGSIVPSTLSWSENKPTIGIDFASIMQKNATLSQENMELAKIQEEKDRIASIERDRLAQIEYLKYQDYIKNIPSTTSPSNGWSSSSSDYSSRQCWVNGYTRSNGTHVSGYYRSCR